MIPSFTTTHEDDGTVAGSTEAPDGALLWFRVWKKKGRWLGRIGVEREGRPQLEEQLFGTSVAGAMGRARTFWEETR